MPTGVRRRIPKNQTACAVPRKRHCSSSIAPLCNRFLARPTDPRKCRMDVRFPAAVRRRRRIDPVALPSCPSSTGTVGTSVAGTDLDS